MRFNFIWGFYSMNHLKAHKLCFISSNQTANLFIMHNFLLQTCFFCLLEMCFYWQCFLVKKGSFCIEVYSWVLQHDTAFQKKPQNTPKPPPQKQQQKKQQKNPNPKWTKKPQQNTNKQQHKKFHPRLKKNFIVILHLLVKVLAQTLQPLVMRVNGRNSKAMSCTLAVTGRYVPVLLWHLPWCWFSLVVTIPLLC